MIFLIQKNNVFMDYLQNGITVNFYDKGEMKSDIIILLILKILKITHL